MNFFKRILSLAASLALCSTFFSGVNFGFTASAITYGNLTYTINNDSTVEIIRCSYLATSIVIPETINGHSVTSIGKNAFESCHNLNDLTIPASLTSIDGDTPFYDCPSLTSIHVNAGNKNYHDVDGVLFRNAFSSGLLTFGEALFQYPLGRTTPEYVIPNSVETIMNYAFNYSKLTSVIIPDSVTAIGAYSFFACPALKECEISYCCN
jgi:hypothetical protein